MPADAPWTKVYHEDFLQGCMLANLTADEIGVYTVVLMLMAARGGPIEFDSAWINSYARCPSQRKCTGILERLIAIGKLERRGRLIGNARMIRIVEERNAKSAQASKAALTRWHSNDGPELPLPAPAPAGKRGDKRVDKGADNGSDKPEITEPIKQAEPQKSAVPDHADASSLACARDSEAQSLDSTHPIPQNGQDADADAGPGGSWLDELEGDVAERYRLVAAAAGFAPRTGDQGKRATRQVEAWHKDGIDFEQVVLPVIRKAVADNPEPTRILGRFDVAVRHEHARRSALNGQGRTHTPAKPRAPVMLRPDEKEEVRPFREALLAALGPSSYCHLANKVTLSVIPERAVLRVTDPRGPYLLDEHRPLARRIAKECGWKDVW